MPNAFDPASFAPAVPVPVIAGLTVAAMALTLYRAWRGRPLHPSWLQLPVVALRWAALLVLALVLLNPSETVNVPVPESRHAVLLDSSASMTLAGANGGTRWAEAAAWTTAYQKLLTDKNIRSANLVTFATDSRPVTTEDLPALRPAGQETLLAAALENLLQGPLAANLEHVTVVSDGNPHDRHRLTGALAAARQRGVTVSAKLVGVDAPARNASLASVLAPRQTRPKAKVTVPVTIESTGIGSDETVFLTLRDEQGGEVVRQQFLLNPTAPDQGNTPVRTERRLSFETGARTSRYTLELSGPDREVTLEDNRFPFTVEVIGTKLKVLMVEGTHVARSVGTSGHVFNDIELMTKAWDATGEIEWEVLTPLSEYVDHPNLVGVKQFVNGEMLLDRGRGFPKTREEIFKYDVMMISDVPVGNFTEEQMQIVVDWVVERGGGFLMGGGYTTFDVGNYDKTPWEKIIPVDMLSYGEGFFEHDFSISIPEAVRNHPIWQITKDPAENLKILETHPRFGGMNRVRRAKPGALVLAVRPEENNEPVFAAQTYGRGRSIAYLSDPNGGWAKYFVTWGPPGGPPQGRHTELGHGASFVFRESVARAAQGPTPPHPSPWYGQFWVNTVKWLGENSIRWRRDKLAGKIIPAQAVAGKDLAVTAEVLAVTKTADLVGLDVGARLDAPGSPRVRLRYDRDRREFVGQLPVPASIPRGEVKVLFDTLAGSETLTDSLSVGLAGSNREFVDTAPNAAFLRELTQAGGGAFAQTPEEAATACLAALQARAREASRTLSEPLWSQWPWWAALMGFLGLEWLLRRLGNNTSATPKHSTT